MFKVSSRTRLRASLLLAAAPALAACGSGDDTIVKLPTDGGSDATTVDSGSDAAGEAATSPDAGAGDASDGGGEASAAATASDGGTGNGRVDPAAQYATATKIKHVVVIFGENISFDH